MSTPTPSLHVTDPVGKIIELVRKAENGDPTALDTARVVLANAVIKGRPLDRTRLQQLVVRCGRQAQKVGFRSTRAGWRGLLGAIFDYLEHGQVPMPDGRVATADGWNYDNCESTVPVTVELPESLHQKLLACGDPQEVILRALEREMRVRGN